MKGFSSALLNRSGEPALWIEKIGLGLNDQDLEPKKLGCMTPSKPIVIVQSLESDGRNGTVNGGAGSVTASAANAEVVLAAPAESAKMTMMGSVRRPFRAAV